MRGLAKSGQCGQWIGAQSSLRRPDAVQADIAMTREIVTVARPLGIAVHDHLIVGKDGHASFKALRLI